MLCRILEVVGAFSFHNLVANRHSVGKKGLRD